MRKCVVSGGYVYVMKNSAGLVKIGSTNRVKSRLSSIRCGDPTIELVYQSKPLSNRSEVERSVHVSLSGSRVSGEWFDCSSGVAVKLIESAVSGVGDVIDGKPEVDAGIFESRLEMCMHQAVGIEAKINFDSHPEIVAFYIDHLSKSDPCYLKVYSKREKAQMFIEAATMVAAGALKK